MYNILLKNIFKIVFYAFISFFLAYFDLTVWAFAMLFLLLITAAYTVLLDAFPMVFDTKQIKAINGNPSKKAVLIGFICWFSGMGIGFFSYLLFDYIVK